MSTPTPPSHPLAPAHAAIGVVIVTYHSAEVIQLCLRSVTAFPMPVAVVDNASADDTVAIARTFSVTVLANSANRGFAAAVNQGCRALNTPFVLILNPDVCLSLSPEELLPYFSDPAIAAVAGTLVGNDGLPQTAFQFRRFPTPSLLVLEALGINRLWPGNPANRHYRYAGEDSTQPGLVEQPAGAFLLVRRAAWEQIGGLDERFYPLWFEDVDFCLRLVRNGFRILRVPNLVGSHAGAHSISALEPRRRQLYWYRSLLQYAAKHFSATWVRFLALSILVGSALRAVFGAALMLRMTSAGQTGPILLLAARTFLLGKPASPLSESTIGIDRVES